MITEHDLEEAIAECQGQKNPNANTCIKLAAFYTIKNELFGNSESLKYSYAPATDRNIIIIGSDSEFARAINGRDQESVWKVLDELMNTIHIIQPRLYNAVMDKLDEL